ncbi:MAG: DUF4358 domain-containing protein [Oscillospiraceae bacterium]|nr:DUF4358 domain-containing protein [Oscillospiraceae bacterium]
MIQRKRILAALLGAALLLGALAGCGGGGSRDVPVSELTAAISGAIGKTDSLTESDGMFLGLTQKSADEIGEHAVLINVYGANVDEYGVFKAGSMSAKDLKALADDYLKKRLAAWMDEYMPEEKPKLTNAEVQTDGDYVMYCILSDADKDAAFKAFSDTLHGKS